MPRKLHQAAAAGKVGGERGRECRQAKLGARGRDRGRQARLGWRVVGRERWVGINGPGRARCRRSNLALPVSRLPASRCSCTWCTACQPACQLPTRTKWVSMQPQQRPQPRPHSTPTFHNSAVPMRASAATPHRHTHTPVHPSIYALVPPHVYTIGHAQGGNAVAAVDQRQGVRWWEGRGREREGGGGRGAGTRTPFSAMHPLSPTHRRQATPAHTTPHHHSPRIHHTTLLHLHSSPASVERGGCHHQPSQATPPQQPPQPKAPQHPPTR